MTDAFRSVVVDASAILALLHDEPGSHEVESNLDRASLSAVNLAEVLQKSLERGVAPEGLRRDLESLGISIVPFTAEDAVASAELRHDTRHLGLSLGDRACLALALRLSSTVLTADRVWGQLQVGVEVNVIR